MRWTGRLGNLWVGVCAGLAAAGCDSATGNKDPKITLSVPTPTATVGQGGATTVAMTLARTNYTGAVALTVDGLPVGVTAAFTPASLPDGTAGSSLLISATGAAAPGASTLTVHATGQGVAEHTATIDLTVTVTGSYSLASLRPSVTVAQGGGGMATVLVTRIAGNAGSVSLAVSGAPAGVTASFSQATTTERGASLSLVAVPATVPSTYTLTITGTSPGLEDQTTTLSLVVIAPPGTANLTLPFCLNNMPVWFAYQNEGYAWQQVTPAGNSFSFMATQGLSIGFVLQTGTAFKTYVYNATRTELDGISDVDCSGPNSLTGTANGVSAGLTAIVSMGPSNTTVTAPSTSYTLSAVPNRSLDLVATRGTLSQGDLIIPDRMIIRRGLTQADNSSISELDFSTQSFVVNSSSLTITNVQPGDELYFQNFLITGTATSGLVHNGAPSTGSVALSSVPASELVPDDLHQLYVDVRQSTSTALTGRSYFTYFGVPGPRNDALGPTLNGPTATLLGSAPYVRMRGQLVSQPEYDTSIRFAFDQGRGFRTIFVGVTAAYLGATPTMWDAEIPDFSGTAGFSTAWMLAPGIANTAYQAEAFSGRTDLLFGAPAVDGDLVKIGYRVAFTSTALRYPVLGARVPQRVQYFRR
jgi:hypothetical protein